MDEGSFVQSSSLEGAVETVSNRKPVTFETLEEYRNPVVTFYDWLLQDYAVISIPVSELSDEKEKMIKEYAHRALRNSPHWNSSPGIHIYQARIHPVEHEHPDIHAKAEWLCCIAALGHKLSRFNFTRSEPNGERYDISNLPITSFDPSVKHMAELHFARRPQTLAQLVISIPHIEDEFQRIQQMGDVSRGYFGGLPAVKKPTGIYIHEVYPHNHSFSTGDEACTLTRDIGIAELYSIR